MSWYKNLLLTFFGSLILLTVCYGQCTYIHYTLTPNTNICGSSAAVTLSGSEFGVTYQLFVNGSAFGSSQAGNGSALSLGTITSSQGGTLMVQGTKSGCSSQVVAGSQVFFTQAYPQGGSISSGGGTMICSGTPITLTFNPPDGQTYSYQWNVDGSAIPGATSSTYSAIAGGAYSLNVSNLCGGEAVTGPTLTVGTAAGTPGPVSGNANPQTENNSATYTVTAATHATSYSWSLSVPSAGAISGTGTSAVFSWNLNFTGAVTVNATAIGDCGYTTAGTGLLVTVRPKLNAGTLTDDFTNYNTAPGTIVETPASGGFGTISYQWEQSTNGTNFTTISVNGTAETYTPPALTVTTWYRRKATSNGIAATTTAAKVTVYPQLNAGTLTAATLNYNVTPVPVGQTSATGGNGIYVYAWLQSTTGSGFVAAAGTNNLVTYTPPAALTASMWYERTVTSYGAALTTAPVKITVYPQLVAGSLTAATLNYGASPVEVSEVAASGGAGATSYSYTWQYSTDGTNYSPAPGTNNAEHYTPPAPLIVSTWYRRMVASNSVSVTTTAVKITVYPQLTAAITPVSQSVLPGTTATTIVATPGGGSGTYTYQWQNSINNLNFSDITLATTASYAPPSGADGTTWYRINITSNGVTATATGSVAITSCLPLTSNPTTSMNYRITNLVRLQNVKNAVQLSTANTCDVNQTIEYFDGLGKSIQTVSVRSTPAEKDLVQAKAYDPFGREVIKYLPYASTSIDGSYKPSAISEQLAFYNPLSPGAPNIAATNSPFAEASYEASPLNRITAQSSPGDVYLLSAGHTVKIDFTANDQTTFSPANTAGSKKVIKYLATINPDLTYSLSVDNPTTYATSTLMVSITKDENWIAANGVIGTMEEYKDTEGNIILRRTYNKNGTTTEMLSTYYVYNDMGKLVFVLPPQAEPDNAAITGPVLNSLCYQYAYDYKGRLSQKRIPGKGWEFMVYNKIDKVVLSQDASQRNKAVQEWSFSKYDNLGRPILSGIWAQTGAAADASLDAPSRTGFQALAGTYDNPASNTPAHPLFETVNNAVATGYTTVSEPQQAGTLTYYTVRFYDDYIVPNIAPYTVPSTFAGISNMTRGLPTTSFVYILGSANKYLCNTTSYDDFGHVVTTFVQHYLNATVSNLNYDKVDNVYNFDNSLATVTRNHYTVAGGAAATVSILNDYDYDQVGRLKRINKTMGTQTFILSQQDYNELGQLAAKHLHSTNLGASFLQDINYKYNERGWLTKINNPTATLPTQSFGMQLYYGDHPTVSKRQYNGNIATMTWRVAKASSLPTTPATENYDYKYDNLNRLTSATYTAPTAMANMYNETATYNKNGNLTGLIRNGNVAGAAAPIDNLGYIYANSGMSNQLLTVTDGSANTEGLQGDTNYGYDNNGNMNSDDQKAIGIQYNFLNLPTTVTKTGNTPITYTYAADGRKLRKTSSNGNRDYINGIEYLNGAIDFIMTEEGRAFKNSAYSFEYLLKDHLGNTRVTVKDDGTISQVQDYYAFGLDIHNGYNSITSPENNYKYNGKELNGELGLNLYDYGARFYDPVIGRWTTPDPMAELGRKFSPYSYCLNNPVRFIDPDGNWIYVFENGTLYQYKDGKFYSPDGKEVDTSTGHEFLQKIGGALEEIRFKKGDPKNPSMVGGFLLSLFSNSDTNAYIYNDTKGIYGGEDVTIGKRIFLSGVQRSVMTTDGLVTQDLFYTIFHELVHAYSSQKFNSDITTKPWVEANQNNGLDKDIPNDEILGTYIENFRRIDNNDYPRNYYSLNHANEGRKETKLLQDSGNKRENVLTPEMRAIILQIINSTPQQQK